MKQALLCIALAVGAFGQSAASSADRIATYKTGGQYNGRFWKSLESNEKIVFVFGYKSAVREATIAFAAGDRDRYNKLVEVAKIFWPGGLTGAEISSALDHFYETPENGPIIISDALEVVARRLTGEDEGTLQKLISDLRASAGK